MEVADSVSCDLFKDDSYQGCREAELRISEGKANVSLHIETTHRDTAHNPELATSLKLRRMETNTISQIQEKLEEWLDSPGSEKITWETRPLEGKYEDSTSTREIHRLEITLSNDGLTVVGITPSDIRVDNAVSIPSATEIHDGEITSHSYLQRMYSLLELFLSGYHDDEGDLFELSGRIVKPERHIHQDLLPECQDRLESNDHKGVVQKAGEILEETLEQQAPDEIVEETGGATNLARRAFNDSPDGFLWGYVPGEQDGIQNLFSGAFLALRNPTSHPRGDPDRNRYLDDLDRQDAIDALCFFNFLIRKLDTYERELELDESEWDL